MQTVEPIRKKCDIEQIKKNLKLKNQRDYLLFVIGINSGLRISDLLRLKVVDVKNKNFVDIIEQKTGKKRRLFLNETIINTLNIYIKGKDNEQLLFKSQKGKDAISRIQAYRVIKSACKTIGLKENFGTHTLRKTFGYHFYQLTKDVVMLQNILNHSSPEITLRYIGIDQDIIDSQLKHFIL